jgi:hypothetical protein
MEDVEVRGKLDHQVEPVVDDECVLHLIGFAYILVRFNVLAEVVLVKHFDIDFELAFHKIMFIGYRHTGQVDTRQSCEDVTDCPG